MSAEGEEGEGNEGGTTRLAASAILVFRDASGWAWLDNLALVGWCLCGGLHSMVNSVITRAKREEGGKIK